jgi:Tol biopolymer transport system component
VRQDPTRGRALWRVPFLGGSPRRLIDNVDTSVGWAPNGRHLAFVRGQLGRGRTALIVAYQDGTNERELTSRETPTAFIGFLLPGAFHAPAWSPDGLSIAVLGQSGTGSANAVREVVFVQVATGATRSQPIPASGFGRGSHGLMKIRWSSITESGRSNGLKVRYAARLNASTCRNHLRSWFQPAIVWSTIRLASLASESNGALSEPSTPASRRALAPVLRLAHGRPVALVSSSPALIGLSDS